MAGKNTSVFGIYSNYEQFEQGIDALRRADFRATDISVLHSENVGTKDLAHQKATKAPEGGSCAKDPAGPIRASRIRSPEMYQEIATAEKAASRYKPTCLSQFTQASCGSRRRVRPVAFNS